MLPKFTRSDFENAFIFISKFKEVYVMIKLQHMLKDAIKLHFILFALKDNAKMWLYSVLIGSITSWK